MTRKPSLVAIIWGLAFIAMAGLAVLQQLGTHHILAIQLQIQHIIAQMHQWAGRGGWPNLRRLAGNCCRRNGTGRWHGVGRHLL